MYFREGERLKMSGLTVRGSLWNLVQLIRPKVQTMFSRKYLLFTNTGITLCLGCSGDYMQQRYEMLCKRQTDWNAARTRRVFVSNLFVGPTCHYWYLFLDTVLPGRTATIVLKKILVDQLIFSPVTISMFLVIVGLQEGRKGNELVKDLKDKGKDLLVAEWIVWPPAQMINFFLLPTKYRVLYDNTVSLGFDYYYSYVKYSKDKDEQIDDKGDEDEETADKTDNCDT